MLLSDPSIYPSAHYYTKVSRWYDVVTPWFHDGMMLFTPQETSAMNRYIM